MEFRKIWSHWFQLNSFNLLWLWPEEKDVITEYIRSQTLEMTRTGPIFVFVQCCKDLLSTWLKSPYWRRARIELVRNIAGRWHVSSKQCDQTARLFFNIRPFKWTNICPRLWQSSKLTSKNLPKTSKILPKWQNFAKSGHTGSEWICYCWFSPCLIVAQCDQIRQNLKNLCHLLGVTVSLSLSLVKFNKCTANLLRDSWLFNQLGSYFLWFELF